MLGSFSSTQCVAPILRSSRRNRGEGADHHDLVVRLHIAAGKSIEIVDDIERLVRTSFRDKLCQRVQRRDADSAANAGLLQRFIEQAVGMAAAQLAGNGIAIAELGQQTASGISLTGVAHAPAWPVESLMPVKNSPTTAR
ncbi:hypothetical protein SCANM63S_07335 [Streptomyces canarius]